MTGLRLLKAGLAFCETVPLNRAEGSDKVAPSEITLTLSLKGSCLVAPRNRAFSESSASSQHSTQTYMCAGI